MICRIRSVESCCRKNGYSMVEALAALLCAMIVSSLGALVLQAALKVSQADTGSQEQFAILQIREQAAISAEARVEEGRLILLNNKDEEILEFHSNRLVKRPGYEILMERVEEAAFQKRSEGIFLTVRKSGKSRTWQITG